MEKGALVTLVLTLAVVLGAAGLILPGQLDVGDNGGKQNMQEAPTISPTRPSTTGIPPTGQGHVDDSTKTASHTNIVGQTQQTFEDHIGEKQRSTGYMSEEHAGPMGSGMMGGDMGKSTVADEHGLPGSRVVGEESMMGEPGMEECALSGRYPPQANIMWLLQNHGLFNWTRMEYPDNRTIVWEINAATPEAAERLYEHILQMECILENGGTPRAMDPVFRLESMVYDYINTSVVPVNNTMLRVVKTGANTCAYEVVKLHAEVVEGFFERGMDEARRMHPVPEDVLAECEELVGEIDLGSGMGMHGQGMQGRGH